MNPQLPIGPRNVPPEPGDVHNASWNVPNEVHHDMPTVTFWQAVQHSWRNLWNQQAPQVEGDHLHEHVRPTPLER